MGVLERMERERGRDEKVRCWIFVTLREMLFSTWPRHFSKARIEATSVIIFGRRVYPSTQHNVVIVGRRGVRLAHGVCLASIILRSAAWRWRKRSGMDWEFSLFRSPEALVSFLRHSDGERAVEGSYYHVC